MPTLIYNLEACSNWFELNFEARGNWFQLIGCLRPNFDLQKLMMTIAQLQGR